MTENNQDEINQVLSKLIDNQEVMEMYQSIHKLGLKPEELTNAVTEILRSKHEAMAEEIVDEPEIVEENTMEEEVVENVSDPIQQPNQKINTPQEIRNEQGERYRNQQSKPLYRYVSKASETKTAENPNTKTYHDMDSLKKEIFGIKE